MQTTKTAYRKHAGGRLALLQGEHLRTLVEITRRMPQSSMDELTREFVRPTGVRVGSATIRKALKHAGIQRVRPLRRAGTRAPTQGAAPPRWFEHQD